MSAAVSDTSLVLRNVTKNFGGLTAVSQASLEVAPGAVHGLIGPNGAGKSTLIGIVSGFVRPFEGEVRFAGRSLAGRTSNCVLMAQCPVAAIESRCCHSRNVLIAKVIKASSANNEATAKAATKLYSLYSTSMWSGMVFVSRR